MAGQAGGLTFCLDHNFSLSLLAALRATWMEPLDRITHLAEQGIAGNTPDEEWMIALQRRGQHAVITRDGAILRAAIRRAAWRASGIMLLVLNSKWANLRRPDLARSLIYWWPALVAHAEASAPGSAWIVALRIPTPPTDAIRLIRPPQD